MSSRVQRKLTTILAADAEGYSRAMAADEIGALASLRGARDVFARLIERHDGRIVNTAGDGLIAEFPSVVEAVSCAIEVQRELGARNRGSKTALRFRIGVHLGDVMIDGTDLLGEGVNLAARLQTMAAPGEVLVSRQVYDQVHAKLSVGFEYLGEQRPKNFAEDVGVFRITTGPTKHEAAPEPPPPQLAPPPPDLRARVIRHAKQLGVIWAAILVVDLVTGEPFWSHWPGIGMAVVLGLEAVPLFCRNWFGTLCARGAVLVAGLTAVNLATWDGYLWVAWPAGVVVVAILLYRFRRTAA